MNKPLAQTLEFSKFFKQHIGSLNEIEPLEVRQHRIRLIFEEFKEYAEASDVMGTFTDLCIKEAENNCIDSFDLPIICHIATDIQDGNNVNKTEQLDALTDLTVVVDGSKVAGGFHEIADKAADLVFQNNMTKAHRDMGHIIETSAHLGIELKPVYSEGKWLAYNLHGKLIKPHDHVKVALSTLL